jgi:diadenosine tetraphosphate (Ap4A) HIT family hydrolase
MSVQNESCLICDRVSLSKRGENPFFIHEFKHSIFIVGDHQFHKGYSLLLLKEHVRELHELEPSVQTVLFQELMTAARALVATFQPWKMNYACYGNAEPHIHWHLFPRYDSEPDHTNNPWLHSDEFKKHMIDAQSARTLAEQVRRNLIANCNEK